MTTKFHPMARADVLTRKLAESLGQDYITGGPATHYAELMDHTVVLYPRIQVCDGEDPLRRAYVIQNDRCQRYVAGDFNVDIEEFELEDEHFISGDNELFCTGVW